MVDIKKECDPLIEHCETKSEECEIFEDCETEAGEARRIPIFEHCEEEDNEEEDNEDEEEDEENKECDPMLEDCDTKICDLIRGDCEYCEGQDKCDCIYGGGTHYSCSEKCVPLLDICRGIAQCDNEVDVG